MPNEKYSQSKDWATKPSNEHKEIETPFWVSAPYKIDKYVPPKGIKTEGMYYVKNYEAQSGTIKFETSGEGWSRYNRDTAALIERLNFKVGGKTGSSHIGYLADNEELETEYFLSAKTTATDVLSGLWYLVKAVQHIIRRDKILVLTATTLWFEQRNEKGQKVDSAITRWVWRGP